MGENRILNVMNLALKGEIKEFNIIFNVIRDKSTSAQMIKFFINHCEKNIDLINELSIQIVWTFITSPSFDIIYEDFMELLIKVLNQKPFYLEECIKNLLNKMSCKGENHKHILDILTRLFVEIPNAQSTLVKIIVNEYPNPWRDKLILSEYIEFLLNQIIPINFDTDESKIEILDSIIRYLIRIDDECINHFKNNQYRQNKMDYFEKIDLLILQCIEFLSSSYGQTLHEEFSRIILKYSLSLNYFGNLPYLLIYVIHSGQNSELLEDSVLEYLWKLFNNPQDFNRKRRNAIQFLGSILGNFNQYSERLCLKYVEKLFEWALHYIAFSHDNQTNNISLPFYDEHTNQISSNNSSINQENNNSNNNHLDFYLVIEMILYIINQNAEHLFISPKAKTLLAKLNWDRLMFSRLNPLNICSAHLVYRFNSLMRSYHLLYCDTIIRRNIRLNGETSISASTPHSNSKLLSKFKTRLTRYYLTKSLFPFERYGLEKTQKYFDQLIKPTYHNIPMTRKQEIMNVTNVDYRDVNDEDIVHYDNDMASECEKITSYENENMIADDILGLSPIDKPSMLDIKYYQNFISNNQNVEKNNYTTFIPRRSNDEIYL